MADIVVEVDTARRRSEAVSRRGRSSVLRLLRLRGERNSCGQGPRASVPRFRFRAPRRVGRVHGPRTRKVHRRSGLLYRNIRAPQDLRYFQVLVTVYSRKQEGFVW